MKIKSFNSQIKENSPLQNYNQESDIFAPLNKYPKTLDIKEK